MSKELSRPVWNTDVGDPTAKCVLVLLGEIADRGGFGWPSVRYICKRVSGASLRTIQRVLQTFVLIGLVKRSNRWLPDGRHVKGYQLSLEKLGTDLSEEYLDTCARLQNKPRKKNEASDAIEGENEARVVFENEASDAKERSERRVDTPPASFPPHPLIGGTVIEPLGEPGHTREQTQKQPQEQPLPKSTGRSSGELKAAATWLLEEVGIASSSNDVRMVAQVISYVARDAFCEVQDAAKALESAARNAMERGELVNVFWFKDRKFAKGVSNGTSGPSKSKQRIDGNRRAIAEVLAKRGIQGPWNPAQPDGQAIPTPGRDGFDGGIPDRLRAVSGEVLPPERGGRDCRTAH